MQPSEALEIVMRTDPGLVRAHNEDAVFGDAARGLAILADGMGGYNAGEVASGMTTHLIASGFASVIANCTSRAIDSCGQPFVHDQIEAQVTAANSAIFNAAYSKPQYAGMGTTLVLVWFYDNRLYVAHIGDSRLYRWRGNRLQQLTRDHSLLQDMIDNGMVAPEAARHSPIRNLVTRALGVEPTVEPELADHDVRPGDIYLLCSDGLNDMVTDAEIGLTLQAAGANPRRAAEQLIEIANRNGGRDNVSVILIKVHGDYAAPRRWWQKLLARLK